MENQTRHRLLERWLQKIAAKVGHWRENRHKRQDKKKKRRRYWIPRNFANRVAGSSTHERVPRGRSRPRDWRSLRDAWSFTRIIKNLSAEEADRVIVKYDMRRKLTRLLAMRRSGLMCNFGAPLISKYLSSSRNRALASSVYTRVSGHSRFWFRYWRHPEQTH